MGMPTTYSIARDTGSSKPKITQIQGDCPVCGAGPNTAFTYGDAANPLLPTQTVDGRQLITQYAYNVNGRMTSKTEAAGTPLARTTTYQYGNAAVPRPSSPASTPLPPREEAANRTTVLAYNAAGDLQTRTIQGAGKPGAASASSPPRPTTPPASRSPSIRPASARRTRPAPPTTPRGETSCR